MSDWTDFYEAADTSLDHWLDELERMVKEQRP